MPFLYCTIKLLACICSQVVFFRTLPLAPSGGDRWFCADRKMWVSEYKGSLLALLNENILFKVPKTSAYGRFLNAKRSWRFWGVRNSLGGVKWQAIFLTWRSNSPPLIPKTLTLVLLKALIRTNDNRGFLFKLCPLTVLVFFLKLLLLVIFTH